MEEAITIENQPVENIIQEKAERIRDVIRYISKFKNAAVVIHLDDRIIDSPLFSSHIRDISLLHEAGLRVIIVPGAKERINTNLTEANIPWKIKNGSRITTEEAMPIIKDAAFDVSNIVMTSLAGQHLTAVIGNWVRARGRGVLEGIDYATAGEIDKIDVSTLETVLDSGFIPIFPCIGWSLNGKPYNISSNQLAAQIQNFFSGICIQIPDFPDHAVYCAKVLSLFRIPDPCIFE